MTAKTEITELIRSELCRFLQYARAGKTGVKLDMDNPAAEVSAHWASLPAIPPNSGRKGLLTG